jgi:uncharacterized protein involved in cysteine biosynthesis
MSNVLVIMVSLLRRVRDYRGHAPHATVPEPMLSAFALALGDLGLPAMRRVLYRSIGLAVLLFAGLLGLVGLVLSQAALSGISWLDWIIDLLGGAAALVGAIFLFPTATIAIVPFFLDAAAAAVEARHYPDLPPARPATLAAQAWAGIRLALLAVGLNLLALPVVLLLPLVGLGLYLLVNGWLLGREYFELAALRRLDLAQAKSARRACAGRVWLGGIALAAIALVPFGNLVVPLLGAAAFVHVFHRSSGLATRRARV